MKIFRCKEEDLDKILDVERRAFTPSIQTTEGIIRRRLDKKHIYLGVKLGKEITGTLALRFAQFIPNFEDFCKRNKTFYDYAENNNDRDANAVFIYSIGIIPKYRNGVNAKNLLQRAFDIAKQENMEFLVGDARIPSYNGSNNLPYEQFEFNPKLHEAIDNYHKAGQLPSKELLEKDPVAGFYLKIFPNTEILGITDNKFWEEDKPCGGHMVIEYLKLK